MPRTLKAGSKGIDVIYLQSRLKEFGCNVTVLDGIFGDLTEQMVKRFQEARGLSADGVVGQKTWSALAEKSRYHDATERSWDRYRDAVENAAEAMQVDPATLIAVIVIESGGRGLYEGRPIIRFENHLFSPRIKRDLFLQHFRFNPHEPWKDHQMMVDGEWTPVHTGAQSTEYQALNIALRLAMDEAYRSISMGAPQILGSWYQRLGYIEPRAMFQSFQSEVKQINALLHFLKTGSSSNPNPDHRMVEALQKKDWHFFAEQYNGKGQAAWYSNQLEEAFNVAKALQ